MLTAAAYIKHYQLLPHPEGGWYKENYRSTEQVAATALPNRFEGNRSFSTAIYFLLEAGNFSAFHRIKSDECWHFYSGHPLDIFVFEPSGLLTITRLGNNPADGSVFQFIVPANCWFASRPAQNSEFCFVGCTVAPGFDFEDFEMANADALIKLFPEHEVLIQSLCR